MTLTFHVSSELYNAGLRDDGTEFHAERFFILAEDDHGNRWAHQAMFDGCETGWNSYVGCNYFRDIRTAATAKAERLLARIEAAGGRIDLRYWREQRPCYGSAAYQQYGQFNDWMEEEMERLGC